jgi:acetolactate synthase small subunit
MEKAILKTLIYADIFDYPMLSHEIHKWLIGKKATIEQTEKVLKKLVKNKKIVLKQGVYFLRRRHELVKIRQEREKVSQSYYVKAQWIVRLFKIIPWIQLVGISGSLAMRNASKTDDIDLFVISRSNRVWLTRVFTALILELVGERRQREASKKESQSKICLNLLVSEDALVQSKQNLYIAHEILQLKVLWERSKTYQKFLEVNEWTTNFLPNWIGISAVEKRISPGLRKNWILFDYLEKIVEFLQRRYMGKLSGNEQVGHQLLYFHPEDQGAAILEKYSKRIKKI